MTATKKPRFTLRRRVSTGSLPANDAVRSVLHSTHDRVRGETAGSLSQVYPALGRANPEHFGIALVSASGAIHEVGQSRERFTLMSVSKPFVFAIACQHLGIDRVRGLVGVNATGRPFNSAGSIEAGPGGRTNPMVNAGAIATTSLIPGSSVDERWEFLRKELSIFAGRELTLDEEVLASARETNFQNRGLAMLLAARGAIEGDPLDAVEIYTRQSSLSVTALDLAAMGATLSDGGVNPMTREKVIGPESARAALIVMSVAGLYETSGSWLMDVGLPGKSGIGGGIVTVSPGKGGLGTYSPLLDQEGNSVRGQLATGALSRELGLDLFASAPPE